MPMKTLMIAILALGWFATGCRGSLSGAQTLPQAVVEDHSGGNYIFPAGVYYAFDFGQGFSSSFEVNAALTGLHENRFRPLDIWYKPGSSSCVPPGSDVAMTVMVEPVLIIRFKKPQPGIERLGYRMVDEPSVGSCAYYVRRYRL